MVEDVSCPVAEVEVEAIMTRWIASWNGEHLSGATLPRGSAESRSGQRCSIREIGRAHV